MTVAFVTDAINDTAQEQINALTKTHSVCVFLPEGYNNTKPQNVLIRYYEIDFNEAMFQRYDTVVFYAAVNWETLLPVMKEVMGIALVAPDSEYFEKISRLSAFQLSPNDDVSEKIANVPKHIHWYNREVNSVNNRLESFGLLSDEVKKTFEKMYGVPLSKEWLSKFKEVR